MSIPVHIITAPWNDYRDALRAIREVVFIEEQQVPRELEWDDQDERSTHFLALNELGQHVGCARLLPSGQIGRMAVMQDQRGTGIGAMLLQAAVDAAIERGLDRVFLHAQSYAEEFYRKGGFVRQGPEFMEAGIPHVSMERKLPLPFQLPDDFKPAQPQVHPQPVRESLRGEHDGPQRFEGTGDCIAKLEAVLASGRRRLSLLSPYLDHELFDRDTVAQLISALARSAAQVDIRIIVFDTRLLVDRGHRLLDLARRLDDKIKIRVLQESTNAETSSFVCADLDAYWMLPSYELHNGVSDLVNPVLCKRLQDSFDRAWAKSIESTELRTLRL